MALYSTNPRPHTYQPHRLHTPGPLHPSRRHLPRLAPRQNHTHHRSTHQQTSLLQLHPPPHTRVPPLSPHFPQENCITTWPQLLLRASDSSVLKSCKTMSTLEGTDDPLSAPIRLLAAVLTLTKALNTIHNRLPITQHTPKQATPPLQSTHVCFHLYFPSDTPHTHALLQLPPTPSQCPVPHSPYHTHRRGISMALGHPLHSLRRHPHPLQT
jgi:hypothetical protein